jgi:hypothetical protein
MVYPTVQALQNQDPTISDAAARKLLKRIMA